MNIKNCKFLKPLKINAIVLYPFVLYRDKDPAKSLISHEEVHLAQIKRVGVIKFYVSYLMEYVQGRVQGLSHYEAYRNISYEKEAFGSITQHVQLD